MTQTESPVGPARAPRRRRRARRGGPRWLDFSIAATAPVVSTASLLVARHQAEVMDRQLAASVWPSVRPSASYGASSEGGFARLGIDNHGTGPARIQSFRLSYAGRALRNVGDLLAACCGAGAGLDTAFSKVLVNQTYVIGRVLSPGEHVDALSLALPTVRVGDTAGVFRRAGRVFQALTMRLCYCSVLDECWVAASRVPEPAPVGSCADEAHAPQYE